MKLKKTTLSVGACVFAAGFAAQGENSTANTATEAGSPPTTKADSFFSIEGTDVKISKLPPIAFHGFASQGYLVSSDYNYLGKTKNDGTFQYNEFGLNASMSPFPHTRIAAQAFAFDLGPIGNDQPALDYALVDYNFCDALGVRGGRIRPPGGIYNPIQDIDVARTFIVLPQGIYDARWRDISSSLNGGSIYGTFGLGKVGGLSYEAFGGTMSLAKDGGVAKIMQQQLPPGSSLASIEDATLAGAQLWWSTPIDGLRAGFLFEEIPDFNYAMDIGTPFGTFNRATSSHIPMYQYSLEYLWKSWTFQAEYVTRNSFSEITGFMPGQTRTRSEAWYVSAAYRFNKYLEAGSYYTQSYKDVRTESDPSTFQKDLALTLRFDPKPWWTIKVEGHYLNGIGLISDYSQPLKSHDWMMLAVKTSFSF